MRINEIVLESTELEEGWKSKLGAAALAGAAALSGGSADAGGGNTLNVVGKSHDLQGNTIVKYQDGSTRNLGTNVWTAPTMAQQRQNQALAKQKADQAAAARASRQSSYAQTNLPQQQNVEPKFDPTQDPFLMNMSGEIDKDIAKFKSYLDSNPTASEKDNVIKQIDSKIKYYFDYIKDVKAARGVSSEENAYLNKKIQGLSILKYGDTVVDEPAQSGKTQTFTGAEALAKLQSYGGDRALPGARSPSGASRSLAPRDGSTSAEYTRQANDNVNAKQSYSQNQSPSSAQSPKAPEAKQTDSKVGFEAKTTGRGTGLTKNGDKYTGEWKDGFADGSGERTLVNKGYTGGMVKTGNKLDTQWKNGVPVDGAPVKVTTPDGKVFNGHIKRGDENPWGYMIVK